MQPHSYDTVSQKALDIHGITLDDIRGFQTAIEGYREIESFLSKYINKYSKEDKFTPVGYNVGFDTRMLRQFFKKSGNKYYGAWIESRDVDVLSYIYYVRSLGVRFPVSNFKLSTMCDLFGINIKAHDAMSDTEAARDLYYLLGSLCHDQTSAQLISDYIKK